MALPESPAERHAAVAGEFSRLVESTPDFSAPAPVEGWTAVDVVDHLVSWFRGFLSAGGIDLPAGPPTAADPVAAWHHHADAVQALITDRGEEEFTHPYIGTLPLAVAADRFYVSDVFMHSWDLARAGGQEAILDEEFAADLLAGMAAMEEVLRGSGQYGAPVAVAADAPVLDRLMGFVGRDPGWRPSAGRSG